MSDGGITGSDSRGTPMTGVVVSHCRIPFTDYYGRLGFILPSGYDFLGSVPPLGDSRSSLTVRTGVYVVTRHLYPLVCRIRKW